MDKGENLILENGGKKKAGKDYLTWNGSIFQVLMFLKKDKDYPEIKEDGFYYYDSEYGWHMDKNVSEYYTLPERI